MTIESLCVVWGDVNSMEVASMSGHLQLWLQMPELQKANLSKCSKHRGPPVSTTSVLSFKSLIDRFAAANDKLMFSGTCLALVLAFSPRDQSGLNGVKRAELCSSGLSQHAL